MFNLDNGSLIVMVGVGSCYFPSVAIFLVTSEAEQGLAAALVGMTYGNYRTCNCRCLALLANATKPFVFFIIILVYSHKIHEAGNHYNSVDITSFTMIKKKKHIIKKIKTI